MPLPMTTDRVAGVGTLRLDRMHGDGDRLDQRRVLERQRVGQPVENRAGHGDELGERAVPAVVAARDAEDLRASHS